ncbi:MAG TPA: hypothetical protein VGL02_32400, partial [Streptomyces sp.]
MVSKPLQIRVNDDMQAWLAGRADRMHGGSPDLQARTELGMWRAVLDLELRRMLLTLNQVMCLADILNG